MPSCIRLFHTADSCKYCFVHMLSTHGLHVTVPADPSPTEMTSRRRLSSTFSTSCSNQLRSTIYPFFPGRHHVKPMPGPKPLQKNLFIAFDAFGTLFTPRAPIGAQYGEIARKNGICKDVSDEEIMGSFKKGMTAERVWFYSSWFKRRFILLFLRLPCTTEQP